MELLILFVSILLNVAGALIALAFVALFISYLGVGSFKAFRILVAMLNFSIAEPEAAIIRNVQKLNILSAKKKARKRKVKSDIKKIKKDNK